MALGKLPRAVLCCLFATLACQGQDYHWLLGKWEGHGYVPGSSYSTYFIYTLSVDLVNRNEFRGSIREEVPDNLGTRKDVAISGIVVGNTVLVSQGQTTYKKEPPQGYWADCNGCPNQVRLLLSGDSIQLIMETTNCGPSCNGTTVYARLLSTMDTAMQRSIVKATGTPAQIATYRSPAAPGRALVDSHDGGGPEPTGHVQPKTMNTDSLRRTRAAADTIARQLARTKKNIATYNVSSKDITIELFDNGEIDGDTVTVYHNKMLIADRQGLGLQPITLSVQANASDRVHEFILVANNLGRIPPNTALMRITAGKQVYEIYPSTNLSQNASVILIYSGD
ncbi:MAG TPA: hypothetical protein VGC22_01490 [Chitinophaga sp.]